MLRPVVAQCRAVTCYFDLEFDVPSHEMLHLAERCIHGPQRRRGTQRIWTLPIAQMIQEMIELRPHYGAHYPRRRLHLVSISAQSSLQAWSRWPGKAPREACNTEERRPEATKRLSATEERHL